MNERSIVQAITKVAAKLGNQPSACRRCYIHPAILKAYTEGVLVNAAQEPQAAERQSLTALS